MMGSLMPHTSDPKPVLSNEAVFRLKGRLKEIREGVKV